MLASRPSLIALGVLLSTPATADLVTAQLAYRQSDYPRAAHDYRELAELGQPTAQYDLAVMYARGQGLRQSDINAYAWATLAAENGEARGRVLADELRPLLAPGSEKIADDVIAPFRPAELDARLMPILADDEGAEARCRAFKAPHVDYPVEAQDAGVEGSVFVSYVAMPDGSARSPRVLYALPVSVFDNTVRRAILHTRFPTTGPGTKPIHCNVLYRFANVRAAGNSSLDAFIRMTHTNAEKGDGNAQFLYGMMVMGLPELDRKQSEAIPWFVKSAQQGFHNAQFMVGSSLLIGMVRRVRLRSGCGRLPRQIRRMLK